MRWGWDAPQLNIVGKIVILSYMVDILFTKDFLSQCTCLALSFTLFQPIPDILNPIPLVFNITPWDWSVTSRVNILILTNSKPSVYHFNKRAVLGTRDPRLHSSLNGFESSRPGDLTYPLPSSLPLPPSSFLSSPLSSPLSSQITTHHASSTKQLFCWA